jgi:hypothetical protein
MVSWIAVLPELDLRCREDGVACRDAARQQLLGAAADPSVGVKNRQ